MFLAAAGIAVAACIAFAEPEAAKPKWKPKPGFGLTFGSVAEARAAGEKDNPQFWRSMPKRDTGAFIVTVAAGGNAEKGGLLPADLVTEIDGKAIETAGDFREALMSAVIGGKLKVTVYRLVKQKLQKKLLTLDVVRSEVDIEDEKKAERDARLAERDAIDAERKKTVATVDKMKRELPALLDACEANPAIDKPDSAPVKCYLHQVEIAKLEREAERLSYAFHGLKPTPKEGEPVATFGKDYRPTAGVVGFPSDAKIIQILEGCGIMSFEDQFFMVYIDCTGKADGDHVAFKNPVQIGPPVSYTTALGAKKTIYTARPVDLAKLLAK